MSSYRIEDRLGRAGNGNPEAVVAVVVRTAKFRRPPLEDTASRRIGAWGAGR